MSRCALAGKIGIGLAFAAVCVISLPAISVLACPFCVGGSQTLTKESDQASMIVYGRLQNAKLDPADPNSGTTELIVETVVKPHEAIAGKTMLVVPRYIVPDKDTRLLLFCDFYQGKIDPYRSLGVKADSRIATYLKGALALKGQDTPTRLKYFLEFLEDKDPEISGDAYNEFGLADYKEFRPVAEKAPADLIVKWIQDPNTATVRLGLYGSMLGHCGTPEHAKVLRKLLDESQHRSASGIDGLLAGYIMLRPSEGWEYLRTILTDDKRDFLLRYAVLRTARFFQEYRHDVVAPTAIADAVAALLDQKDIADMAVEELRRWGEWGYSDRVFALFGKPGFNERLIKRAVLKYALSCPPTNEQAQAFIAARQKEDPQLVADIIDMMRFEAPRPEVTPAIKK